MKDISLLDQLGIVHDPDNQEETKVPVMPILIVLNSDIIGQSKTIRGTAALVIGNQYLIAKDEIESWNLRVEAARKEAMWAISRGIFAEVYDSREGIIPNNYAVDEDDLDYEIDEDYEEEFKIHVENDKAFLLSLAKMGTIRLLEREDSFQFRPHEGWENISKNPTLKCCGCCLHKIEDFENGGIFCPAYMVQKKHTDGSGCSSYALPIHESMREYTGGEYIDISVEYDIDELISNL